MNRRCFVIPVETIEAIEGVIASVERDFLRGMMDGLARRIAAQAAGLIDLHHAGLRVRPPDDCPLADATAMVRGASFETKVRVRALVTISRESFSFEFRDLDEHRVGVVEQVMRDYTSGSTGAGTPLLFQVPRGRLPSPKWTSVRKRIPSVDRRLAWLRSQMPQAQHGHLIPQIDRDELQRYGTPRSERKAVVRAALSGAGGKAVTVIDEDKPAFVDHADFVRTFDGQVFVAIMDAGLSVKDRLVLHLSDDTVGFLQGGRQFGSVAEVPRRMTDLLKSRKTVNVVEMKRGHGQNEIKAKHVALVHDVSSNRHTSVLDSWKARAIGASIGASEMKHDA